MYRESYSSNLADTLLSFYIISTEIFTLSLPDAGTSYIYDLFFFFLFLQDDDFTVKTRGTVICYVALKDSYREQA